MHDSEQNSYEILESRYQLAIDLRLSGATYQRIANYPAIMVKEHTVRTWFMEGGICREAYDWKRKIRADDREEYFKSVHEQIRDLAMEAVYSLRGAIRTGNVNACAKILELVNMKSIVQMKTESIHDEGIRVLGEIIEERRAAAREKNNSQTST